MIDCQTNSGESFGGETVPATIIRLGGNEPAELAERFRRSHLGRGTFVNDGNTCPRHFKIA